MHVPFDRASNPATARTEPGCVSSTVVVRVAGGFGGAFRVASMLHTRQYQVRRMSMEIADDGCALVSVVTDISSTEQMQMLLARLSRLPLVLTAARA